MFGGGMCRDQAGHDVVAPQMGIPPQILLNGKKAAHLNVKRRKKSASGCNVANKPHRRLSVLCVSASVFSCARSPFTALAFATAARQLLSDVFG
jgi:hypothetical protein